MVMKQRRTSITTKALVKEESNDSDAYPSSPSSIHSEDELHDISSNEWATEWFSNEGAAAQSNWTLNPPKFKFCKKRKEYFTDKFDSIWYKAPYKYNALLHFTHGQGFEKSPFVQATMTITFEDGTPIDVNADDGLPSITRTESIFRAKPTETACREVKLGPFQFNVCSYKYDGKRFRLNLNFYLVQSENGSDIKEADLQESTTSFVHICSMVSPAFLIKAKKPIAKPGIKSKKRPREAVEEVKIERSMSPNSPAQTSMEINHIPIAASYQNAGHFDIKSLASLPLGTQKQIIQSQLLLLNSILPMGPAVKKTKLMMPGYINPQEYVMPSSYSFIDPSVFTTPQVYQQQHQLQQEPFKTMEQLVVEEPDYIDLMTQNLEPNTQGSIFDLDSYTGPQLATGDSFASSENYLFF